MLLALLLAAALARAFELNWSQMRLPFWMLLVLCVVVGIGVGLPALKRCVAEARRRRDMRRWQRRMRRP